MCFLYTKYILCMYFNVLILMYNTFIVYITLSFVYRPFHKTLPRSSAFVKWNPDCTVQKKIW